MEVQTKEAPSTLHSGAKSGDPTPPALASGGGSGNPSTANVELDAGVYDVPVEAGADAAGAEVDASSVGALAERVDNLTVRRKRLSGAQRRKIAKAAKKATGDRAAIPAAPPQAGAGKSSAAERLGAALKGAGQPGAGGSDPNSQGTSGTPIKRPLAGTQGEKQGDKGPKRPCNKGTPRAHPSYKDAACMALQAVIQYVGGPSGHLTLTQPDANIVSRLLDEAIAEHIAQDKEPCLQFYRSGLKADGTYWVSCATQESLDWLLQQGPTTFRSGALKGPMEVVKATSLPTLIKCYCTVPGSYKPDSFVTLLRKQNPRLKTENWRVWAHKEEGDKLHLTLGVDEDSLPVLGALNWRPFLGRGQAYIIRKLDKNA